MEAIQNDANDFIRKSFAETLLESMSDGLIIIDKEDNCLLLNCNAREFVYNPEDIKKVQDLFSCAEYYDLEQNKLDSDNFPSKRILKGERIKEMRVSSRRPDGIFHFNISGNPICNETGDVEKAVICIREITKHVIEKRNLIEESEELGAILENMSDALMVFNNQGIITKVNSKGKKLVSPSLDKMDVNEIFIDGEVFDMEGSKLVKEKTPISKILRGEKVEGYHCAIKKDNKISYVESNGGEIRDEHGNFITGILLTHDVTDKIKYHEQLMIKTQYATLNSLIENLDLGIARCSYPEFNLIDMNSKFSRGLKAAIHSEWNGDSLNDINLMDFTCDKVDKDIIFDKLINKKEASFIVNIDYMDGKKHKFKRLVFQLLRGLNGRIIEVVVMAIDITEEVTEKNKMQEVLKLQEELFANVSHELKTPINVIFSTEQLMELYLKNNSLEKNKEKINKSIILIKQNCYRSIKLINNIIDISKIESGFFKLSVCDENIVQIVEDIVLSISEYIEDKKLNIVFDTDIEERIISCDPEKIERIILNLISNAIKFTNPGGTIFVDMFDKGNFIEICIRDTGIGIEKKHLNNIFDRFHQVDKALSRNTQGSGIGLTLVKLIVELHGGIIEVQSEVGQGTTFKIILPTQVKKKIEVAKKAKSLDNKVEMINIEFADIYSL